MLTRIWLRVFFATYAAVTVVGCGATLALLAARSACPFKRRDRAKAL